MSESKSSISWFLTPGGALLACFAFFLPWVKMSCSGQVYNVSGFQMAKSDGFYWVIFACALLIAVGYFFFKNKMGWGNFKKLTLGASAVGLGLAIYKYVDFRSSMSSLNNFTGAMGGQSTNLDLGNTAGLQDLQFSLQIGAYACLVGFVFAFLGGLFMPTSNPNTYWSSSTNPNPYNRKVGGNPAPGTSGKMRSSADAGCGFCTNGLPAELLTCPQCGAPSKTVAGT